MIGKIKAFLAIIVLNLGLMGTLSAPLVRAQVGCGAGVEGLTNCVNQPDAVDATADTSVNNLVKRGIQIFQVVVGIISVVMVIMGGLKYITSGGDSGKVGEAKNAILYAVIGLIVVGIAQVIVQFALNRALNSDTNSI